MYMTLPEGWPDGLNIPIIVVGLNKALYTLKHQPQCWHNYINPCLVSLESTLSQCDPVHYLGSDGVLMLLYVDDMSLVYPKDAIKAANKVKARLSEKYKSTNHFPAPQFVGIIIHREWIASLSTNSLARKAFTTTILKWFNMHITNNILTPMDRIINLDLVLGSGGAIT